MAPIRFVLDGVLAASCDQEAAYARVGADAIEALLRGQSRALVACGAAGAGKTYSLFGSPELLANPSSDAWKGWGLLPRTGHHLFARANAVGGLEALCGPGGGVKCSFLEIFDERLANPNPNPNPSPDPTLTLILTRSGGARRRGGRPRCSRVAAGSAA